MSSSFLWNSNRLICTDLRLKHVGKGLLREGLNVFYEHQLSAGNDLIWVKAGRAARPGAVPNSLLWSAKKFKKKNKRKSYDHYPYNSSIRYYLNASIIALVHNGCTYIMERLGRPILDGTSHALQAHKDLAARPLALHSFDRDCVGSVCTQTDF